MRAQRLGGEAVVLAAGGVAVFLPRIGPLFLFDYFHNDCNLLVKSLKHLHCRFLAAVNRVSPCELFRIGAVQNYIETRADAVSLYFETLDPYNS